MRPAAAGLRQNAPLQQIEVRHIAKPEGFIGGHRVDDPTLQLRITTVLQLIQQLPYCCNVVVAHQTAEATGYQILLACTKQDATGILQKILERLVVSWRENLLSCYRLMHIRCRPLGGK